MLTMLCKRVPDQFDITGKGLETASAGKCPDGLHQERFDTCLHACPNYQPNFCSNVFSLVIHQGSTAKLVTVVVLVTIVKLQYGLLTACSTAQRCMTNEVRPTGE